MTIETLLVKTNKWFMPHIFLEISKNEMIFKTPLETKQETIPIENTSLKLIFFKIKKC